MSTLHVLVVDDHALLRAGLVQLFSRAWPSSRLSEAADGREALARMAAAPDIGLVLADVHLPGGAPLQLLRELRQGWPLLPVVMLTGDHDPGLARQAWRLGASAYLTKDADLSGLGAALAEVMAGGRPLPALLAAEAGPRQAAAGAAITPRQWEVLRLLREGMSNKEIGRALNMAEPTVKTHLVSVFRQLGVRNRAQAAVTAQRVLPPARAD